MFEKANPKRRAIELLLITGVIFFAPLLREAHADPAVDQPVLLDQRSAPIAAVLGGVVGFGAGDLYSRRSWTARSSLFFAMDAVLAGTVLNLVQVDSSSWGDTAAGMHGLALGGVVSLLVMERILQGAGAYRAAQNMNDMTAVERTRYTQRVFPESAAFLGLVGGFGSGHFYASQRWTKRSTLFAGLDVLGLAVIWAGIRFIPVRYNKVGPPPFLVPYLIFAGERVWQGIDARREAETYNDSLFVQSVEPASQTAIFMLPMMVLRF